MNWRKLLPYALVLGAAGVFVGARLKASKADDGPAAAAQAQARASGAGVQLGPPPDWPPAMADAGSEPQRVALLPLEPAQPAAYTMAQAREHGDPRSPPIAHEAPSAAATAAELADPAAYQGYEARQNMKLYANYVQAADSEIPKLREDIGRGRDAGVAPEQIAKAEEKLRRLTAMRVQLLAEHPELAGGAGH